MDNGQWMIRCQLSTVNYLAWALASRYYRFS